MCYFWDLAIGVVYRRQNSSVFGSGGDVNALSNQIAAEHAFI
jgi:hypothetical protein